MMKSAQKFAVACAGLIASAGIHAQDLPFEYTEVTTLAEPWAMAFIPDGRLLVSERAGTLQLVDIDDGSKIEISGVPEVAYGSQSGLGEVMLHPDYADNGWIYFTYSEAVDQRSSTLTLFRAKLELSGDSGQLTDHETLWKQTPASGGGQYGMRIAFDEDNYMFVSVGDRQRNDPAQDMTSTIGKIVRLHDDGSVPDDNPFVDQGGATAEIWSVGHRNPYGLAFDSEGRLWSDEMGPQGGDELNLIVRGDNYGWPEVSNGVNYGGGPIPDHDTRPEFHAPTVFWVPSISPSSLMFYDGDEFPEWQGDAFIGALGGMAIIRVEFDGETAAEAERYTMGARIRGLLQSPDGAIMVAVDGGGTGGRGRGGFGGFGGFGGRGGGAPSNAPAGGALLKLTAN